MTFFLILLFDLYYSFKKVVFQPDYYIIKKTAFSSVILNPETNLCCLFIATLVRPVGCQTYKIIKEKHQSLRKNKHDSILIVERLKPNKTTMDYLYHPI